MKAVLNLISLGALAALGAGIWLTRADTASVEDIVEAVEPDPAPVADTIPDNPAQPQPQPSAGDTGAMAQDYTVEGTQPGYFLPADELVYNGFRLDNIHAEPARNGFEESLRVVFTDTSRAAGTNEMGETYYETVWPTIEAWSVTPEGISVTAHHPDIGPVTIRGVYDAQAYAAWTSGAMSAEGLFVADVTLGGATMSGVSFSFWVGE